MVIRLITIVTPIRNPSCRSIARATSTWCWPEAGFIPRTPHMPCTVGIDVERTQRKFSRTKKRRLYQRAAAYPHRWLPCAARIACKLQAIEGVMNGEIGFISGEWSITKNTVVHSTRGYTPCVVMNYSEKDQAAVMTLVRYLWWGQSEAGARGVVAMKYTGADWGETATRSISTVPNCNFRARPEDKVQFVFVVEKQNEQLSNGNQIENQYPLY